MRILIQFLVIFLAVVHIKSDGFEKTLGHLRPKISDDTQTAAVLNLIRRILPERAHEFLVEVDSHFKAGIKDSFKVEKIDEKIKITGSTGVAASWGFHYYLKHCKAHISWEVSQLNLPSILPYINITITANDRFRYYQNVCTTSYSFAWWKWKDWEKHIDWMALNGFNLVLAFNGQEAIWKRVFQKFGLTQDEIDEHFAGPAFFAWNRMGNFRGWGGPLSDNWHQQSLILQKQILQRMRELGIIPVLPGFAGHVPKAFKRIYPEALVTPMTRWNNFEDKYCCPLLIEPTDDLFNVIGVTFMQEQIAEFGTNHIYNCDTFNEMVPTNGDVDYLRRISSAIYAAMTDVDPQAIWLLQGWLFYNEAYFWNADRTKAFLTSVPAGRLIVLDLQSEQFPQYTRLESYFGQPFIWNMLHNFGGTLGMFGSVDRVNTQVFSGRSFENSTMVGAGITPEGINQNYVMYDLMMEIFWRKEPVDIDNWFGEYSERRYGAYNANAVKAWEIFASTVYNYTGNNNMRGKYVITRSPRLAIQPNIWYDINDFAIAWIHHQNTNLHGPGIVHDLVDTTRQVLQILGDVYYKILVDAFTSKQIKEFQHFAELFLQIFNDLETLLSTNEAFLLGKWIDSARSLATNTQEALQYEFNARNQISLWGPKGEIMDYANKQWAGVVSELFGPRWNLFISAMNDSLINNEPFDEHATRSRVFEEVELPFTRSTKKHLTVAKGDTLTVARDIHERYKNISWPELAELRKRCVRRGRAGRRCRKRAKGRRLGGEGRVQRSSEEIQLPEVIGV